MKIYSVYVLKQNSKREKYVIYLMIPNGDGWHYIAVKTLPTLLTGITSKHYNGFYCLNCLHSLATKKKTNVNLIKKYVKIKIFVVLRH